MQRYRHYGASYSSSSAPVEEAEAKEDEEEEEEEYAEEEVCEEEQPLLEEGVQTVIQDIGGVNEEEVPQRKGEVTPVVSETEAKVPPVESKNGKKTEGGGDAGGGGGPKYSMFTWFVVLALLGVWSSVAVVYFDIVDYDSVIGKLTAYDTDGDGDFDVEDAKVLLGLKEAEQTSVGGDSPEEKTVLKPEDVSEPEAPELQREEPPVPSTPPEAPSVSGSQDVESEIQAAVPLPPLVEDDFVPDDPGDSTRPHEEDVMAIDSTGVLLEETLPEDSLVKSGQHVTSSRFSQEAEPTEAEKHSEERAEPEPEREKLKETENLPEAEETSENQTQDKSREKVKKKKPKLLNKFDKTIKAEIDAADKLLKKGKVEEALRAFEALVQQYPQSPRALYGKAQAEDEVAEKLRSNDMLLRAVNSYREAAELPDATPDLLRAALKRRAERQQFLGRMRGSLATLDKLVQIFPEDVGLKNDLGVAHLLLGDNKGAKKVYEEVLEAAPGNGFAKVHYGFILKSENKIAESIPYLKEGLESGEPGTDDGRFYFHLGDALQRVGDDSAYHWYELGHKRGHFASVWQRSLYNVKGLKAQPWWTPKETGYTDLVKTLERNWRTIRDEALAVMDQKTGLFVPEEENLREKGEWGQYTLWQQGRKDGNSCQGVQKTCSLLERYTEATGCKRGQIKFSVMQPGTHVWPHTGPTNCRLRMHLGLVVPKQGCRIRCTNQTREWQEGKVLIFDDSFEHEVWQDAVSHRLIFIVDVWHPELTQHQRQTLSPI
ncbi:aspartyl/asparaginyl beta-hydroxylase-like isoform X11 [Platichthys flesus]|uniref:aspartyl/asparaginyl beta-hydroxylase-like isoform X11 n=1 Tax=Platichthys flesus TaxID=8260 RepID=UPI002DC02177|nr:aspartyl/asparaginyl beta-hydroxylase-like isoform X11 [Platichthys flesus]